MSIKNIKVHYKGSYFWLIFWLIIFFPVAFVLLFTAATFEVNQTTYNLQYDGSRFWLAFWTIVFFPVSFLLLFLNGYSITIGEQKDQNPIPPTPSENITVLPKEE